MVKMGLGPMLFFNSKAPKTAQDAKTIWLNGKGRGHLKSTNPNRRNLRLFKKVEKKTPFKINPNRKVYKG